MLDILVKKLIKPIIIILFSVLISFLLMKNYTANNSASFNEQDFEKYINENAELIISSVNKHYENLEANKGTVRVEKLKELEKEIFSSKHDPFIGNENAKIRVVEFFDYNCGYCKKVYPTILKLNKEFENVKIVFKEMPILGAPSLVKSKVSLAAFHVKPEKYIEAHGKIMNHRGQLNTVEDVANLLQSLGYDKDELIKKAESEMIANALEENKKLAFKLQVSGTPAFIVEDEFVDGAISFDGLKALVNKKIK
mgnify:CR=1 FL=1|jgi:protein-disulfide isomerase